MGLPLLLQPELPGPVGDEIFNLNLIILSFLVSTAPLCISFAIIILLGIIFGVATGVLACEFLLLINYFLSTSL